MLLLYNKYFLIVLKISVNRNLFLFVVNINSCSVNIYLKLIYFNDFINMKIYCLSFKDISSYTMEED